MLRVQNLRKSFGGSAAVAGVTVSIETGSVTGLIGPNGAGKSTLLDLIGGAILPDEGSIHMSGTDITKSPRHERARTGIGRSFQVPKLFRRMTVLENMLVVMDRPAARLRDVASPGLAARRRNSVSRAMDILDEFALSRLADEWAETLSGGQRKLLSLARLAVSDAPLILLDEPAAGVNPTMVDTLARHVGRLNAAGKTLLVVEHNLRFVEMVAPRVLVMAEGRLLCEGSMEEIRQDAGVREAYIGKLAGRRDASNEDAPLTASVGAPGSFPVTVPPATPKADPGAAAVPAGA